MKNKIYTTPSFEKKFKKYKKKFKSLNNEIIVLIKLLEENAEQGVNIGDNIFKIRLACKSKGTGKSGGFRVIIFYIEDDREIYLITMYDKSEEKNIHKNKLILLIKKIFQK